MLTTVRQNKSVYGESGRRRLSRSITVTVEPDELLLAAQKAALKIQRVWRGCVVRRKQELYGIRVGLGDQTKEPSALREQIYLLFEDSSSSNAARMISVFIQLTIIVSIICLVCETLPNLKNKNSRYHVKEETWYRFEVLCSTVFTVEFVARLAVCNVYKPFFHFWKKSGNYFDLMAIAPFYLDFILGKNQGRGAVFLRVFRAVRLSRLLRIFRLGTFSSGLRLMATAIIESVSALNVLVFFITIGVILFSSMVFYTEKQSCPSFIPPITEEDHRLFEAYTEECRVPSNDGWNPTCNCLCCDISGAPYDFADIPHTFWWAIVTMTTVGYGDVTPKTILGRFTGSACMLCGILLIALPIAIVGRNFQDAYQKMQDETVLDTGKGMSSERFRRVVSTVRRTPKMPTQELLPDLNALTGYFATSVEPDDELMHHRLIHMCALVDQMQTMNETLHRLETAEHIKQTEIFSNMEELSRNLQKIKNKS